MVLFLSAGCATDRHTRETADVHLRNGIANIESGQYTTALRELFEARRLNPEDPEIYYYLGLSFWGRGLRDDSFQAFRRAVELKPDYSEAYNYLGLIRFEEGRYDEAVAFFRKALDNVLYETPEFALFNTGRAYREKGAYEKALAAFTEALNVSPNRISPIIHENAGRLLLNLDRPDEALMHLRECVKQAPYVANFRYSLGKALLAMNMRDDATAELKRAIELAPDSETAAKARNLLATVAPRQK
ncbi:MAG: hypothetical protein AVO39_02100 [delta proteobacterium MLS_D]|nr:MAG: hypothetical protein AVO39_02100 [delta proteobacterium MLS_D]